MKSVVFAMALCLGMFAFAGEAKATFPVEEVVGFRSFGFVPTNAFLFNGGFAVAPRPVFGFGVAAPVAFVPARVGFVPVRRAFVPVVPVRRAFVPVRFR